MGKSRRTSANNNNKKDDDDDDDDDHRVDDGKKAAAIAVDGGKGEARAGDDDDDENPPPRGGQRQKLKKQDGTAVEGSTNSPTAKKKKHRETIRSKPLDLSADFVPPAFPKTAEQIAFLEAAIESNFIFMDLCREERLDLVMAMRPVEISNKKKGRTCIIRKGDVGDFFYVVERGTVYFVDHDVGDNSDDNNNNNNNNNNNKVVGQCTDGGSFGELALLYDCPRAVSCVAAAGDDGPVQLWKVDQNTFRRILARSATEKRSSVQAWLRGVKTFEGMQEEYLSRFAEAMVAVHWSAGDCIVKKGEAGTVFYIVQEGQVKVHDIGLGDSKSRDHTLGPGCFFGTRSQYNPANRMWGRYAAVNVWIYSSKYTVRLTPIPLISNFL